MVCTEKTQRENMLPTSTPDRSALAITTTLQPAVTGNFKSGPTERTLVMCDYYGKPCHTRKTCWKLHGHPSRGRGGRSASTCSQAHQSEATDKPHHLATNAALGFSPDQVSAFQHMI